MDTNEYKPIVYWLEQLPDARGRRGRRYAWSCLVRLWSAAVAAGCRGPLAMHEWVAHHQVSLAARLGEKWRGVPSESTFQRLVRRIQGPRMEQVAAGHNEAAGQVGRWRDRPAERFDIEGASLDGKWLRQASAHGERHLLLGLCRHRDGVMLRQERVPAGRSEEGWAPRLLDGLDLRGCLVTMDAGLTSRAVAEAVVRAGGDYLMVVKGDTPQWYGELVALFAVPPSPRFDSQRQRLVSRDKGHGRLERREVWVSSESADWMGIEGAQSMLRRQTQRVNAKTGEVGDLQTTYAVSSLPPGPESTALLARLWRDHWSIENRNHWVRDVSLGEDRCATWRGSAPQVMAALRNMLLAAIRRADCWGSVPSALRWAAANPIHAMQLVGA